MLLASTLVEEVVNNLDIILVEEEVNNLDSILVSTREEEEGERMVSNNKRRRVNGSSCSPTSTHLQTQILWERKMAGTVDARLEPAS